jgi:hypothetical protein
VNAGFDQELALRLLVISAGEIGENVHNRSYTYEGIRSHVHRVGKQVRRRMSDWKENERSGKKWDANEFMLSCLSLL